MAVGWLALRAALDSEPHGAVKAYAWMAALHNDTVGYFSEAKHALIHAHLKQSLFIHIVFVRLVQFLPRLSIFARGLTHVVHISKQFINWSGSLFLFLRFLHLLGLAMQYFLDTGNLLFVKHLIVKVVFKFLSKGRKLLLRFKGYCDWLKVSEWIFLVACVAVSMLVSQLSYHYIDVFLIYWLN